MPAKSSKTAELNLHFVRYKTDPATYETEFFSFCIRLAEVRLGPSCKGDSQQVAQDFAVRLWTGLSKYDSDKAPFSTYFDIILRAVRNDYLSGVYKEAECIDHHAQLDSEGNICTDIDDAAQDYCDAGAFDNSFFPAAPRPVLKPTEHDVSGVDLGKLEKLPNVMPELVELLCDGYNQAECQRILGVSRKTIRVQVERIKKQPAHLNIRD